MGSKKTLYTLRTGFHIPSSLNEIIKEANRDPELLICLRGKEIHIYYKGGKILGLRKNSRSVSMNFDKKYLCIENKDLAKRHEWLAEINRTYRERVESNPKEFFCVAKQIMSDWFKKHPKQERDDQQQIALCNPVINEENELAVVDIEYAVSANSPCYNKTYKDTFGCYTTRYPNPRFDIIAIDRKGQIYVLELKTGLNSTKNSETHITDFVSMIGSHRSGELSDSPRYLTFLNEMSAMIESLNDMNLKSLPVVDKEKAPIFGFVYTVEKEPKCKGHTPDYQKKRIQQIVFNAIESAVKSFSERKLQNDVENMINDGYIQEQVMILDKDFKLRK